MSGFVFEYLCGAHKWCTFVSDQPRVALQALAEFDPQLSSQWEALLAYDVKTHAALTRDLFDDELTNTEASLSRANVAETVIAGCRRRLLVDRHASLEALKCGFTFKGINVTLQLAAMPRPVVLLLTRCKVALSAEELMDSFNWDVASTGFQRCVPGFLRNRIHIMDQLGRLRFLRWCTGVNALPADGLRHGVTLLPL